MSIQLVFDKDSVSWTYNEQKIVVKEKNISYATEKDGKYVYIECRKNFILNAAYYYNLTGSLLLSYSIEDGIIYIGNKKIHIVELKLACFYPNQKTLLLLAGKNEKKIIAYSLEGIVLFETESPKGYEMKYFQSNGKEIYVVCDGDKQHGDEYGRFSYNFLIDLSTGKLTKRSLAY